MNIAFSFSLLVLKWPLVKFTRSTLYRSFKLRFCVILAIVVLALLLYLTVYVREYFGNDVSVTEDATFGPS